MSKHIKKKSYEPVPLINVESYLQNESWFEIRKLKNYTLVINSYGRLRKLYHQGGYKEVHSGGVITIEEASNAKG